MTAHTCNENTGPDLTSPCAHSWVEVDLAAVRHNVRVVKQFLGPDRWLWAVVKANAYGHGAVEVSQAAAEAGVDGLALACLDELAQLRLTAKLQVPLLVLGPGQPEEASWLVRLNAIQTVSSRDMVQALSQAAQRLDRPARVHLKVDTGMTRFGVRPEQAAEFASFISASPGIELTGVFSHMATAEDDNVSFARQQFACFQQAVAEITAAGVAPGMLHLANSAAALRFPEMILDGIRAGLLIYGIQPEATDLAPLELHPVLSWKTRLSFLQRVPAGCAISYGCTYTTPREAVIGVLPLGYADGYPRRASNTGRVLVRGVECPIVGMVCMDYMMIDLSAVPEARVGDEVVLLGRQGKALLTANQLAAWAGTVPHEVPTMVGRRVSRVYLDEAQ